MGDRNQQYEAIFFQTDQYGAKMLSVNGEGLGLTDPLAKEGGVIKFIRDLGLRRYTIKSQEQVGADSHVRINWVFEKLL